MKTLIYSKNKAYGFSLVQLLGVVAIVGILAGVGSSFLSNLNDSVLENKLSAEVATLNSAAATYLGFGGNFDDVTKPEDALSKLRSVAHSDIASRIP